MTPSPRSRSMTGPSSSVARLVTSLRPILTANWPIIRAFATWLRPLRTSFGNRAGPSNSRPIGAYTNVLRAWSTASSRGLLSSVTVGHVRGRVGRRASSGPSAGSAPRCVVGVHHQDVARRVVPDVAGHAAEQEQAAARQAYRPDHD